MILRFVGNCKSAKRLRLCPLRLANPSNLYSVDGESNELRSGTFCSVFTSKDNFHVQIVPLFLDPTQTFVNGIDLKCYHAGVCLKCSAREARR